MYNNLKKLAQETLRLIPEEEETRLRQYLLKLIRQKHPEYFEQYPDMDLLQDPASPVGLDIFD